MTFKKYSFFTIFTYGLALFSPLIWKQLDLFQKGQEPIHLLTLAYFIAAGILISLYFKQKSPLSVESKPKTIGYIILLGIAGIFAALLLQGLLLQVEVKLFNMKAASQNTQQLVSIIRQAPLFILASSIAGPIMEEFVFRRALVGLIEGYSNYWIAALISALLFAFAHNDSHLLIYGFLGFFLSLLYRFSGSIWTPVITHAGMNTLVILVQVWLVQ